MHHSCLARICAILEKYWQESTMWNKNDKSSLISPTELSHCCRRLYEKSFKCTTKWNEKVAVHNLQWQEEDVKFSNWMLTVKLNALQKNWDIYFCCPLLHCWFLINFKLTFNQITDGSYTDCVLLWVMHNWWTDSREA